MRYRRRRREYPDNTEYWSEDKIRALTAWNGKNARMLAKDQQITLNVYEMIFRDILDAHGIKYEYQKPFYDEIRYVCVDFYIFRQRIVIELDGIYHYKYEEYDQQRTDYLIKRHNVSEVIRIQNFDLIHNTDAVITEIIEPLTV